MAISIVIFIIITLAVFGKAWKAYSRIWKNIQLGKSEKIGGEDGQRWKNVLLIAFGQRKMFVQVIPAIMHLFIYTAFLLTQIELIEILIDGIFGTHRFFAIYLGSLYTFAIGLIEVLSALALIATFVFLIRRNVLKLSRFWKDEMFGWPRLDANLILLGEIILVMAILTMNSADAVLQQIDPSHYPSTGNTPVSSWLGPLLFSNFSTDWLMFIERIGWWAHVLVVYGFILYLPYSKHLHIFLAFPNTWFSRLKSRGEMTAMPEITHEVRSMLGLPSDYIPEEGQNGMPDFGANDIIGLSWKTILDAYTCTECGRCTNVCPANQTGKKLSPRKVMMDIRDRVEEVSDKIASGSSRFINREVDPQGEKLSIENFSDGVV